MNGLIQDPRILLGNNSTAEMPGPMDIATQMIRLGDLARLRDVRDLDMKTKKRQQLAAEQLAQALPMLAAGKSVDQLAAQFPEAAGELMTKDLALKKEKRAIEDSEAGIKQKETERRIKALDQVSNLAHAEAQNPNPMSIKKVISMARYYGVDLPFPSTNVDDPAAAGQYLKMLADTAYDIKDRVVNEQRAKQDAATLAQTQVRDRNTQRHQEQQEAAMWQRLKQDEWSAPVEGTVGGQPGMVVFNKRERKWYSADDMMAGAPSSAAMGAGGGGRPGPAAAPTAAPAGYGLGDRSSGGTPAPAAPVERRIGPKQPPPTSEARNKLLDVDEGLAQAERAIQYATHVPSAFKTSRGIAPMLPGAMGRVAESAAGKHDRPEEGEARAYIYNIVSATIKERSGTAATAAEQTRLNSFLPGEMDDSEQIINKMRSYIQYLKDKRHANPAGRSHLGGSPPPLPGLADSAASRVMGSQGTGAGSGEAIDIGDGITIRKRGN